MRALPSNIAILIATTAALAASPALAQKKYGPGASDTEIRIGNTVPYSGPASAYGILGKAYAAYFRKINDEGGINGRKIIFISYDDAYSPPKTVEQTRKLVESDEVMAIVGNVGTAANAAVQKYLNAKKTPQLYLPPARPGGMIRKASHGRWAGCRATTPRPRPMQNIC